MGLNNLALDCDCCVPLPLRKATMFTGVAVQRVEGRLASSWAPIQDSSWQGARDSAFSSILTVCPATPLNYPGSDLRYLILQRHCPASWVTGSSGGNADGFMQTDYQFYSNVGRWG